MEPIKENIVDQETDFEPIGYVKKLYIRNANNLKKCMINTLVISIM